MSDSQLPVAPRVRCTACNLRFIVLPATLVEHMESDIAETVRAKVRMLTDTDGNHFTMTEHDGRIHCPACRAETDIDATLT